MLSVCNLVLLCSLRLDLKKWLNGIGTVTLVLRYTVVAAEHDV